MPTADRSATLRLAIVDTDRGFLQVLTRRLDAVGWRYRLLAVAPAPEDVAALRLEAMVVDLLALGDEGWSYLERVRAAVPELPLVVCSGPSNVAQRVRGLRAGADDWLNKPCHPEELVARVEACVRRRERAGAPASGPLQSGEVLIRPDQYQAFVGDVSVDLTRREFELLHLLADAEGRVLPREEIYQRVWGWTMAHGDRSVDVFVRKLRSKLERRSPGWRYIHTHFGVGYRFAPERVAEPDEVDAGLSGEEPDPATAPAVASG